MFQKHPHRFVQRSGQMSDHRVDRDHQFNAADMRRGFHDVPRATLDIQHR